MSSRPIPACPSLEFDRKQAKALLDALHRGDADAALRFRAHHPRFGPLGTGRGAALHDAQLVIAREYGFASWPHWKQFVEARELDTSARAAELVRAACSGDMRRASMLLEVEPALEHFDSGRRARAAPSAARLLARDPSMAPSSRRPLVEPMLYALLTLFGATLDRRGHRAIVRALLDHGATPTPTTRPPRTARPGSRPLRAAAPSPIIPAHADAAGRLADGNGSGRSRQ
jgi:hypothetical protein